MSKTGDKIVEAWEAGRRKTASNTFTDGQNIWLYNTCICRKDAEGRVFVSTGGFLTATTKDRLNSIPGVDVHQAKGVWYFNGEEWTGHAGWTEVPRQ